MVESVLAGSAAAAAGLAPADIILELDGHPLHDVIDYQFYLEPQVQMLGVLRDGRELELKLENTGEADPGIYFGSVIFDRIRTCANRCVFCFIEQVPGGLRPPLYLKDDDFRLSFLYGNFITLGNLGEEDLQRIAAQRLSPLYVSLHATDPAVRGRLMGCSEAAAARGLANLRWLGEAGIETHMQVVLCPGINDGEVLERSVTELASDYSGVISIGVVPVAVGEDYLKENPNPVLRAITGDECARIVESVEEWQAGFRRQRGNGFVYAADEFFLRIGRELPPEGYYDDFPHYENGIGIARSFLEEGQDLIAEAIAGHPACAADGEAPDGEAPASAASAGSCRRVFLLAGRLSADLMKDFCERASAGLSREIKPLVAGNRLFGDHVTVAGLLGGRDILMAAQDAGLARGDLLIIPPSALDSAGERFLDDLTLEELDEALDCDITTTSR